MWTSTHTISLELNTRLMEHRSTIKTKSPGIENLSVIHVAEVPKKDLDEFMGQYSIKDILRLHIREQHRIAKLKTLMLHGLNIRRVLPLRLLWRFLN